MPSSTSAGSGQVNLTVGQDRFVVDREMDIDAAPQAVFDAILEEMVAMPGDDGQSLKLKFEAWPGGRWFRDLGGNAGHLWGHVQVIKPPTLLEITGPLMISMPVVNHVTYRIKPNGNGSRLSFKHRAFGEFDKKMVESMQEGWTMILDAMKKRALT